MQGLPAMHHRRKHAAVEIEDGRDLGPAIRRKTIETADGVVLRLPTAGLGEWKEPADPLTTAKPPVVHGARAMTGLDHLAAHRNDITADHLAAARLYAMDAERIASSGYGSTARLPSGLPFGISAAMIDPATRALNAVSRQRGAEAAMGARGAALIWRLAVDGHGVEMLAEAEGLYRPVLVGLVIGALDRLVEYYWPEGRGDEE